MKTEFIYIENRNIIELKIEHLKTVLYLFAWNLIFNINRTRPDQTRPEGKEEDQKL